jgi:hypothetical protein
MQQAVGQLLKGNFMPRISTVAFAFCLIGVSMAEAAPRSGVDAAEKAAGNPDKVICKRFVRIGTLAGAYRTCKTKREWERERENARTVNWSNPCKSAESGSCE